MALVISAVAIVSKSNRETALARMNRKLDVIKLENVKVTSNYIRLTSGSISKRDRDVIIWDQ